MKSNLHFYQLILTRFHGLIRTYFRIQHVFSNRTSEQAVRHYYNQTATCVDFCAELPNKVYVAGKFFSSYCIKVVSQENTIWILSGTQAEQQLAELQCSFIATFPTKNVDVLQQAFAKCLVQLFTRGRQIHFNQWSEVWVCLFRTCQILLNKLKVKGET